MQTLGPAEEQPDKATLLAQLSAPIKNLVKEDIDSDVEPERLLQVAVALRNELYWRGKQYLKLATRNDGSLGYTPIGTPLPGENDNQNAFSYVFNIMRADGKKYAAVIGQRAPHVKAVPEDPENEDHNQRAREANAVFQYLKTLWAADRRQKEVARHLWRTGPVFSYTPYVSDGDKYGYTEQPKIELVPTKVGPDQYDCINCGAQTPGAAPDPNAPPPNCQQCSQPLSPEAFRPAETVQQPQQVGTEQFPKGNVELHLYTILDVTISAHAKSIEECEYLAAEYDEHVAKLIKLFATAATDATPQEQDRCAKLRELLRSDNADTGTSAAKSLASDAKEILQSNIAMRNSRKNMARFSRYWLRPFMFELVRDKAVRETLQKNYPDGLKLSMVAGEVVDLENEKMDDVWAVFKTASDEKILTDPACADIIPVQNILNHFYNMGTETILRGIPKTIVDSQLLDRKSLEESEPNVAEIIFTKSGGGDISKMMAQLPVARMSDQMMPFADSIRALSRELDGVTEALSGGGGVDNETWRAAEMRKNQALMQLGPDYDEIQRGWEKTYENGTRQLARYGSGTIKVKEEGSDTSQIVDLAALAEDGWHAEANEGIPMSYAEETDRLLFLINQNQPVIQEKLELFNDLNLERTQQLLGLRGFKSARLMEIRATQAVIKELLQSAPLKTTDPMTGQPSTQPSIPPNQFADDHILRSQFIRIWLNSEAGQKEYHQNREGWENVQAYGVAQGVLGAPPPDAPPDQPKGPSAPPQGDKPSTMPSPNESPVQPTDKALQVTNNNAPAPTIN